MLIYLWDSVILPCYYVPECKVKTIFGYNSYVCISCDYETYKTGISLFNGLFSETLSEKHADYNIVKNAIEEFRNNPFFEIDLLRPRIL